MRSDTLYCGFCGKNQHEVQKLIAGPTAHICNECTDLCHEIVHPPEPGKTPPKSPAPYAPGSFGCHEALHLACVFNDFVQQHLAEHPAIERQPEWAKLAKTAAQALYDLYQAIGAEHLAETPNEAGKPSTGEVIGFGEAHTSRDREEEIGSSGPAGLHFRR